MVYIIGHTRKEYVVGGILLPKKEYTDVELARGRKTVVSLTDEEWNKIKDTKHVQEMLEQHTIEALDTAPADKFSTNADLQEALNQSERVRTSLQRQYDELKTEAVTTIRGLQEEIQRLKERN